uniref:Uncharacterized protein n=1 Tax=Echinococcus granulosus TaxID=6210 RepID=A0A068WQV3_ECHGR|nr:hypothetical protein EgrG_000339000 [Echinococcus granulosus]
MTTTNTSGGTHHSTFELLITAAPTYTTPCHAKPRHTTPRYNACVGRGAANMTTQRSRHNHIVAKITRQIGPPDSPTPPSRHPKPPPRRPTLPSRCDQEIASPLCLLEDKRHNPVTDLLERPRTSSSRQSAASDETWLTSSVSVASRNTVDTMTPLPCASTISQCNTNYVPHQATASTDPTEIDKCTELEAMKQGLARIQAGHGRPSDFLPEHQCTNVDPYIRRTLDEIRRSINEISTDAALQQEVQQLRDSVKRLSLCQATAGTTSNKSESQLAGLLQDIRQSLRAAPCEAAQCDIASRECGIMQVLEEIRQSVHELQAVVDEDNVEPQPVVDTMCENSAVMHVLDDIRQSLHILREGVSSVEQDNTNECEDGAIMEALKEIRQSVNTLVRGMEAERVEGVEGAEEEHEDEILEALTEIRNSVRALAGEEGEEGADDYKDDGDKRKGDAAMEMAVCAMVQSMEELQKTVEKISEQLLGSMSERKSQCEKKEKARKRKKTKCEKSKSLSDSEIDEDDIVRCIKECCQDSSQSDCICEKIIKYLVNQKTAAPYIYYLVPPVTQPPTFVAPLCRPPRPMPPPPTMPLALPPPPMTNCPQSCGGSALPQATQHPQHPPFAPPSNLCGAVSMGAPRFCPPFSPPISCPQYHFEQPPPMTGLNAPQQPAPQSVPSIFNQCSNYVPQSACHQPEINPPAPSLSTCNRNFASPPPQQQQQQPQPSRHSSLSSIPKVVPGHQVEYLPLAFTLSFTGTTDAPACVGNESNDLPNYANSTFLCTQISP